VTHEQERVEAAIDDLGAEGRVGGKAFDEMAGELKAWQR
jgi:hypothetical protein